MLYATKRFIPVIIIILISLIGEACSNDSKKSAKAEEHEKWLLSLNDSIDSLQNISLHINEEISYLHSSIDSILRHFEHIENPRLVEGYTIFNGWKSKYPLSSTGLIARMTENEQLELVASLSGGNFTSITVSDGNIAAKSDEVPFDQALNYRQNGLNTVAFSGGKADTIAMLIAQSTDSKVEINYTNPSITGRHILTPQEKAMIAATYRLTSMRRQAIDKEKELMLNTRKIQILHQKVPDTADSTE